DFNLPTIEVSLQKHFGNQPVVVAQQVGLLPVIAPPLFSLAIGRGREHKEAQKPAATSPLPEHLADFLEADHAVSGAVKDFGLFPGDGGVMIDLFGREGLFAVIARASTLVGKTEPQVFASPGDENGAIESLTERGFVAEGAIAHGDDVLVLETVAVKALAQFTQHCHKGCREVMGLFCLAVSSLLFFGSLFARLAHGSDFFKA